MNTTTPPAHAGTPLAFCDAGYTSGLISITPPNAPLTPSSKLGASLGKAPGQKLPSGLWAGFDWRNHPTTRDDVERWAADGANLGLRSDQFPALDIDALDEDVAAIVEGLAKDVLGDAPVRVGRAPKRLLMYKLAEGADAISRMRLHLERKTGTTSASHLIELLGRGQQYLVAGIHPTTGQPYVWDNGGPPAVADLTPITRADVERLFEQIVKEFESLGWTVHREGDGFNRERATVDQDALRAPSIEQLAALVAKIPNDDRLFPSRDSYVTMGIAIRAAAGDEIEEGLDVYAEWASRHAPDGRVQGNPETARGDYDRMHPPFTIGWSWLQDQARAAGHPDAAETFEVVADAPALAPAAVLPPEKKRLTVRAFAEVKPKRTDWLLEGRLARQHITSINGWPGEGKTTVCVDIVARLTKGERLPDGTTPPRPLNVLFLHTEDSASVLRGRLTAAGADLDRVFTIPDTQYHHLTLPSHKSVWIEYLREYQIDVVVVDPMKAFLDDGLNDAQEQDARKFMLALRQVCEVTNTAAFCIRHPNKATAGGHSIAVTSASGALAFTAAARIELAVGRMPDDDETRALAHVKNNLGPPPAALLYRLREKDMSFDDGDTTTQSVAVIEWCGVDRDVTGDDLLARREGREERSRLAEAKEFLQNFLAAGPVEKASVLTAAKRNGIEKRTLERARMQVGWFASSGGRTIWGLTGQAVADAKDAPLADATTPADPSDVTGGAQ